MQCPRSASPSTGTMFARHFRQPLYLSRWMIVKEFLRKKFLSTAKVTSKIEETSDIEDVEEEGTDDESCASDQGRPAQLNDARVVGVMPFSL